MLWYDDVKLLLVQARFIELLYLEDDHVTCKSLCFNLPRNILKFAVSVGAKEAIANVACFKTMKPFTMY